jgi:hypothetical protein
MVLELQFPSLINKKNTKSSTEAELVGVDDVSSMILWTKLFLEEQGYRISRHVLHQDNKVQSYWNQTEKVFEQTYKSHQHSIFFSFQTKLGRH